MHLAVIYDDTYVAGVRTGKRTGLHLVHQTFEDSGHEASINSTTDDGVNHDEFATPLQFNFLGVTRSNLVFLTAELVDFFRLNAFYIRLYDEVNLTELTGTTGLFLMTIVGTGGLGDSLTIRNLRLTKLNLNLLVVLQTPLESAEMELAHTTDDGLTKLFAHFDTPCRILFALTGNNLHHLLVLTLVDSLDAAAIARRRKAIEESWKQDPGKKELEALLDGIHTEGLFTMGTVGPRPLPHVKDIDRACARLLQTLKAPEKISPKDRFRGLTETQLSDAKAGKWTKLPAQVVEDAVRATELAKNLAHRYNTLQLTIRFSRDMELMSSLQALIQRNLADANCALLARTAGTLSKALREGDADFILEKAGIRYHHVLMDEFQDTSRLQWSVIRQLLQDLLASEGNTLLIVGDIKQSIYRWRNGDWHIMESLTGERVNETSLTRNFRSSEEVVRFNLSLFDHIIRSANDELVERIYSEGFSPEKLEQFYQGKKKKGGYVRFHAVPNGQKEDLASEMFDEMEHLLQLGAKPADMMILVREKKDAALITDLHTMLDAEEYPLLSQAAIVSADSFLLEASEAVQTVIAGLKVIAKNDDSPISTSKSRSII